VQSLNETIARLEEEKRSGAKVSSSVAAPGAGLSNEEAMVRSLDMNPVYQNLRLALSQADADLAAVRGQMQAQQALVNDLRNQMAAIPEVEAELARLNRDYDVNKRQYDTLVQRLESARISQSAEQTAENVKLRVLEPPVKPFKPSGPQRAGLNSLVLLAALGAGIGLALLLAQLNPTFSSRELLQQLAGVPVVGVITVAVRAAVLPWYRRQRLLVGAAVSLLVVVFVLNLVLTDALRGALRTVVG